MWRPEEKWRLNSRQNIRSAKSEFVREENFSDLKRNLVKLKTLSTGVRIFNGAVRTEREFPLKILFLACAQGFVVLIITRNGTELSRSCCPKTIYSHFVFLRFWTFFNRRAADKFKFSTLNRQSIMVY